MAGVTQRIGWLIRSTIELGQRLGANITPNHYYSEFPDLGFLKRESYWREPWSMVGVQGAEGSGAVAEQLAFARACCLPYRDVLATARIHEAACADNGESGFGRIEADFLYCFVRSTKPRRIVQVGCGVSTSVILQAASAEGYEVELVCVEPYPSGYLQRLQQEGRIRLHRELAQKADLDTLTNLDAKDLLFVDSTHTVRLGSEVPRLILEVLPRLRTGVMVHFHDIYFPYDFPPDVLGNELFFARESAFLHAFLAMNHSYRVLAALSTLHHASPDGLKAILPRYNPMVMRDARVLAKGDFPSSVYLERV